MNRPTLLADLARELVRTPALRELLAELAPELEAAAFRPLCRALLFEDLAVGVRLLSIVPRLGLGLVSLAAELGRAASHLPGPLAPKVIAELGREAWGRLRR